MIDKPLWRPSQERIEEANLTRFARQAIRDWDLGIAMEVRRGAR
jgi:hypothetical protein